MQIHNATGAPLLLAERRTSTSETSAACWRALEVRRLDANDADPTELRTEATLQELMHEHPELLPIRDMSTAYDDHQLVSLGREVPVEVAASKGGLIDNLYLTRSAKLVIAEAKLFRNPEARRKVVAQILDYAAALASMSVEQVEGALRRAQSPALGAEQSLASFYEDAFGRGYPGSFPDDFESNLRHGEFFLLIVGDGIQGSIGQLSDLVARHPSLHYKLGLVEMREYRDPWSSEVVLIVPRLMTETRIVARSTVRIERDADGTVNVTAEPATVGADSIELAMTIDDYMQRLSASSSTRSVDVASRIFSKVLEDERLESRFSQTYWDVQFGDVPLWRNTWSVGGSMSFNDALRTIQQRFGDDVARRYAGGLVELFDRLDLKANGTRVTRFLPFEHIVNKEAEFWAIIDEMVVQLEELVS